MRVRRPTTTIALLAISSAATALGSPLIAQGAAVRAADRASSKRRRMLEAAARRWRGGGLDEAAFGGRGNPAAAAAPTTGNEHRIRPLKFLADAASELRGVLKGGESSHRATSTRGTGNTSALPPWLTFAVAMSISCAVAAASMMRPGAPHLATGVRRRHSATPLAAVLVPVVARNQTQEDSAATSRAVVSATQALQIAGLLEATAGSRIKAMEAALAAADDATVEELAAAAARESKRRRRQRRKDVRSRLVQRIKRIREFPPNMPIFPLAGSSDSLLGRLWRKRLSILLTGEGAEGAVKPVRPEGARLARAARFWSGASTIYWSYKRLQARCAVQLPLIQDPGERERLRVEWWDEAHDLNSQRMLQLCLSLRGFYLKSGQFLGTRSDFMPKVYLERLSKLHDAVPPMSAQQVKAEVERELRAPVGDVFSELNLTHPVGSASISQVHEGWLRSTGERVAVKVQYPKAERVMTGDLRNVEMLATFLQKFELDFDVLSSIRELSKQIHKEFDFRMEASTMDRMYVSMAQCQPPGGTIVLPHSRLCTKRLLVMTFVRGQSLAALRRSRADDHRALRKRIGKRLLALLADAWGFMIFDEGLLHADPHPGNVLIMPEGKAPGPVTFLLGLLGLRVPRLRVGLLDWGQTKELDVDARKRFARLVLALQRPQVSDADLAAAFVALGIVLEDPNDVTSAAKLARVMFDTKKVPGLDFNPFSANNVLKLNAVRQYPQDLYFVLRTVLMFRGMTQSLGLEDFSLAERWAPLAKEMLAELP